MEKLFYSISETADILGESVSAIRFWSNQFPKFVKPQRNAKGNRQYTAADIEALKQIKVLVKDGGMTLEGANKRLSAEKNLVAKRARALESLKAIRKELEAVRKSL
ncbi:MAG: MerR family transcriptional regulator [Bacteroidales bacterium]|nr:MerR family transcriptional regulator [Bacteroidales bacterium]